MTVERPEIHLERDVRFGDRLYDERQQVGTVLFEIRLLGLYGLRKRTCGSHREREVFRTRLQSEVQVLIGRPRSVDLLHQRTVERKRDAVESGQFETAGEIDRTEVDRTEIDAHGFEQFEHRRESKVRIQLLGIESDKDRTRGCKFGIRKGFAGVLHYVFGKRLRSGAVAARGGIASEQVADVERQIYIARRLFAVAEIDLEVIEQPHDQSVEVELRLELRQTYTRQNDIGQVESHIADAFLVIAVQSEQQTCGLRLFRSADVDGLFRHHLDKEHRVLFRQTHLDRKGEIHVKVVFERPVERYAFQFAEPESRKEASETVSARVERQVYIHIDIYTRERAREQFAEIGRISVGIADAVVDRLFETAVLNADQEVVDRQHRGKTFVRGGSDIAGDIDTLESSLEEYQFELAADTVGDKTGYRILSRDVHEVVDDVEYVVGRTLEFLDVQHDPVALDVKHVFGYRESGVDRLYERRERRAELIAALLSVRERKLIGGRSGDIHAGESGRGVLSVFETESLVYRGADSSDYTRDDLGQSVEPHDDILRFPVIGHQIAERYVEVALFIVDAERLVLHIAARVERPQFEQDKVVVHKTSVRVLHQAVIEIEVDLRPELEAEFGLQFYHAFRECDLVREHTDERRDVEFLDYRAAVAVGLAAGEQQQIYIELEIRERELLHRAYAAGDRAVHVIGEIDRNCFAEHYVADAEVPRRLAVVVPVGVVVSGIDTGLRPHGDIALRVVREAGSDDHFMLGYSALDPVEKFADIEIETEQRAEIDKVEDLGDTVGERIEFEFYAVIFLYETVVAVEPVLGDPRVLEEHTEHYADKTVEPAEHTESAFDTGACDKILYDGRQPADDESHVIGLHFGDLVKAVLSSDIHEHPVVGDVNAEAGAVVFGHLEIQIVGFHDLFAVHEVGDQFDRAALYVRGEIDRHEIAVAAADRLSVFFEQSRERRIRSARRSGRVSRIGIYVLGPRRIKSDVGSDRIRETDRSAAERFIGVPTAQRITFSRRDGRGIDPFGDHRRDRRASVGDESDHEAGSLSRPVGVKSGMRVDRERESRRLRKAGVKVPSAEIRTVRRNARIGLSPDHVVIDIQLDLGSAVSARQRNRITGAVTRIKRQLRHSLKTVRICKSPGKFLIQEPTVKVLCGDNSVLGRRFYGRRIALQRYGLGIAVAVMQDESALRIVDAAGKSQHNRNQDDQYG